MGGALSKSALRSFASEAMWSSVLGLWFRWGRRGSRRGGEVESSSPGACTTDGPGSPEYHTGYYSGSRVPCQDEGTESEDDSLCGDDVDGSEGEGEPDWRKSKKSGEKGEESR